MIVYGEAERETEPRALLSAIAAALAELGSQSDPSHDALRRELIALGGVEAALGDALCPEIERIIPPLEHLRRAATALGKAVWLSWKGGASEAASACVAAAASDIARLAEESWPARVRLRPAEGYAHYALYPESYGEAAARIAAERNPASALVIGIRSIGTSLSRGGRSGAGGARHSGPQLVRPSSRPSILAFRRAWSRCQASVAGGRPRRINRVGGRRGAGAERLILPGHGGGAGASRLFGRARGSDAELGCARAGDGDRGGGPALGANDQMPG